MSRVGVPGLALPVIVGAVIRLAPTTEAYRARPLPAHTGGFGEPSCQKCHWDGPLNDPGGELSVNGLPVDYGSGERHRVTVTVQRPGLRRAGFALAARFEEGSQAGVLGAVDDRVLVQREGGIEYATHTEAGTSARTEGSASWTVEWSEPEGGRGTIVFHVAANASDNDDSELGDFIYEREWIVAPAGPR